MNIEKCFLSATTAFFLNVCSAQAQNCNCPATFTGYKLDTYTSSVNKIITEKTAAIEYRFFYCSYNMDADGLKRLEFHIYWMTKMIKPDYVFGYCKTGPRNNDIRPSKQKVAYLQISDVGVASHRQALFAEAEKLLRLVEPYAISCPGTPSNPPGNNNNNNNPPVVSGSKERGRILNPQGHIEIYIAGFNKWKQVDTERPVRGGDRVKTSGNATCTLQIFTPSGVPDNVLISENTLVEIPDMPGQGKKPPTDWYWKDGKKVPKPVYMKLLEGVIYFFTGDVPDFNYDDEEPFNMTTPTFVTGFRGTEVFLCHDPASKIDLLLVKDGIVDAQIGTIKKEVKAGQQIYTSNGKISETYPLNQNLWNQLKTGKSISNYKNIIQSEFRNEKASGEELKILFKGKIYNCVYKSHINDPGTPVDLYYLKMDDGKGVQPVQDDELLYGRFVRLPAASLPDQSAVRSVHVTWIKKGLRWKTFTTENVQVQFVK
ncbi:MAG: hypothetical protein ACT4OJ_15060 [Bacteroidota bacterium]